MVNFAGMQQAANAAKTSTIQSFNDTFTVNNKETGKSEWNGKNVSIALGSIATVAIATGGAVRYGTSFAGVSEGMSNDGKAIAAGLQGAYTATSTALGNVGTKISNTFTSTFSQANYDAASKTVAEIPTNIANALNSIGTKMDEGFQSVKGQLTSLHGKVDQVIAQTAPAVNGTKV